MNIKVEFVTTSQKPDVYTNDTSGYGYGVAGEEKFSFSFHSQTGFRGGSPVTFADVWNVDGNTTGWDNDALIRKCIEVGKGGEFETNELTTAERLRAIEA